VPYHLHLGEADLLRCRFAVSPLWETQEAVRTLVRTTRAAPTTGRGCGARCRPPTGWAWRCCGR
jgi:hypothetical protein